ncbi:MULTISPECIES: hypothetical protein [unclassified Acidovorax]|uniref:hypothetical protein n=1 Tax=unclassified Acidovorax TaxID=2684926 RepID=UPI001C48D494|nr:MULTISPECIES: hypothetical protein [unclassified Acidovorax]MBV7426588.1 hypothetical protein [Acidovorax sp. sif0732]MBV7447713.1 hypothetical protein [Acidovorax sp. sif0715]
MAKYRILSLDGGGLRGLITARLLARLNGHPQIAGWPDVLLLPRTTRPRSCRRRRLPSWTRRRSALVQPVHPLREAAHAGRPGLKAAPLRARRGKVAACGGPHFRQRFPVTLQSARRDSP